MDDGNRRGWPSRDKDPILTGVSSLGLCSVTQCRQREIDVQLGGWMDGWMDEGKTDIRESYGTWHNLSLCVITSPPDLCTFFCLLSYFSLKTGDGWGWGRNDCLGPGCGLVLYFVVFFSDCIAGLSVGTSTNLAQTETASWDGFLKYYLMLTFVGPGGSTLMIQGNPSLFIYRHQEVGWTAMKFSTHINNRLRMIFNYFDHPLSFFFHQEKNVICPIGSLSHAHLPSVHGI